MQLSGGLIKESWIYVAIGIWLKTWGAKRSSEFQFRKRFSAYWTTLRGSFPFIAPNTWIWAVGKRNSWRFSSKYWGSVLLPSQTIRIRSADLREAALLRRSRPCWRALNWLSAHTYPAWSATFFWSLINNDLKSRKNGIAPYLHTR